MRPKILKLFTATIVSVAISAALALGLALHFRWSIPFLYLKTSGEWQIGLVRGEDPLKPQMELLGSPILTASDVSDVRARFVADPFLIRDQRIWHLFFEVMTERGGVIGLATSEDESTWKYQGVVLDEPFHLSYPFVFREGSEIFMVPETRSQQSIRLYRAADFPRAWTLDSILVVDCNCVVPEVA